MNSSSQEVPAFCVLHRSQYLAVCPSSGPRTIVVVRSAFNLWILAHLCSLRWIAFGPERGLLSKASLCPFFIPQLRGRARREQQPDGSARADSCFAVCWEGDSDSKDFGGSSPNAGCRCAFLSPSVIYALFIYLLHEHLLSSWGCAHQPRFALVIVGSGSWLTVALSPLVCWKEQFSASRNLLLPDLTLPIYDSLTRSHVVVTITASGFQLP